MKMDNFDGQKFYELMQSYRHISTVTQKEVVEAFEEVKEFARTESGENAKNFGLWLGQNFKQNKGKDIDELYKDYING